MTAYSAVGALELTPVGDRELEMRRRFAAPRELVFACHTRPELVRRWLLGPPGWTMPVCEIDLRVGGRYRYEWRSADGQRMGMGGVFEEVEPPERLVARELFDEDWTGGETLVTTTFSEQDGATLVTMRVVYSSGQARSGAMATGMADGMEASYQHLEEVLAEEQRGDR